MLDTPQHNSLLNQTVNVLRRGIEEGEWEAHLPGERILCRQLQVSRPTLRLALEILGREQLILVQHGRKTLILKKQLAQVRKTSKRIALVTKLPLHMMSRNRIFLIDYIQRALGEQGFQLDIVVHSGFGTNQPGHALRKLREQGGYRAFVLLMCSLEVQKWFQESSFLAIILGGVYPGTPIPSVDVDYPSMGQHAAGRFIGLGHRRCVWILPAANHAGNLETEESFISTLQQSRHDCSPCEVIRHLDSSQDLVDKLKLLLDSSERPTAYFVMNGHATTTLVTQVLLRGLRIPRDVSIITRDSDEMLEWITPSIACYMPPLKRIAPRISRLIVQLANTGGLPISPVRMMSDFQPGDSLGKAP